MGRPLKIKQSTTIDIGFNSFADMDPSTQVIPAGMTTSEYLGVVGGGLFAGQGIATPAYPVLNVTAYMPNGLSNTCTIITQKGTRKYLVASSNTVAAGSMTPGFGYVIRSVGNTNWSLVGGPINPQVGDVFTATAVGSGTGTVADCAQCVLVPVASGSLTPGQMNISIGLNTGSFLASRLTNKYVWDAAGNRYAVNFFVAGGSATNPLAGVAIAGTAGQFTCTADTIAYGALVTITGTNTGTGTISGYVSGTSYYVIATNGTTTFTLSATAGGAAITTTAGTTTGLTFTLASSTTAKSGAQIDTWTNGTGNLALAEASLLNN